MGEQLQRQFPNAYQCGRCSHGPIDKKACDDLSTHHGDRTSGGGRINNACPSCGWFSPHIRDWPKWNGTLPDSVDANTDTTNTPSTSSRSGGTSGSGTRRGDQGRGQRRDSRRDLYRNESGSGRGGRGGCGSVSVGHDLNNGQIVSAIFAVGGRT